MPRHRGQGAKAAPPPPPPPVLELLYFACTATADDRKNRFIQFKVIGVDQDSFNNAKLYIINAVKPLGLANFSFVGNYDAVTRSYTVQLKGIESLQEIYQVQLLQKAKPVFERLSLEMKKPNPPDAEKFQIQVIGDQVSIYWEPVAPSGFTDVVHPSYMVSFFTPANNRIHRVTFPPPPSPGKPPPPPDRPFTRWTTANPGRYSVRISTVECVLEGVQSAPVEFETKYARCVLIQDKMDVDFNRMYYFLDQERAFYLIQRFFRKIREHFQKQYPGDPRSAYLATKRYLEDPQRLGAGVPLTTPLSGKQKSNFQLEVANIVFVDPKVTDAGVPKESKVDTFLKEVFVKPDGTPMTAKEREAYFREGWPGGNEAFEKFKRVILMDRQNKQVAKGNFSKAKPTLRFLIHGEAENRFGFIQLWNRKPKPKADEPYPKDNILIHLSLPEDTKPDKTPKEIHELDYHLTDKCHFNPKGKKGVGGFHSYFDFNTDKPKKNDETFNGPYLGVAKRNNNTVKYYTGNVLHRTGSRFYTRKSSRRDFNEEFAEKEYLEKYGRKASAISNNDGAQNEFANSNYVGDAAAAAAAVDDGVAVDDDGVAAVVDDGVPTPEVLIAAAIKLIGNLRTKQEVLEPMKKTLIQKKKDLDKAILDKRPQEEVDKIQQEIAFYENQISILEQEIKPILDTLQEIKGLLESAADKEKEKILTAKTGFLVKGKYENEAVGTAEGRTLNIYGVYKNADGSLVYPDESILYPDGRTVYPDGSIVYPDDRTVYPDGSIAYPDGRTVYPDKSVRLRPTNVFRTVTNGSKIYNDGRIVYANGWEKLPYLPYQINPTTGKYRMPGETIEYRFIGPQSEYKLFDDGRLVYSDGRVVTPLHRYESGAVVYSDGLWIEPDGQIFLPVRTLTSGAFVYPSGFLVLADGRTYNPIKEEKKGFALVYTYADGIRYVSGTKNLLLPKGGFKKTRKKKQTKRRKTRQARRRG